MNATTRTASPDTETPDNPAFFRQVLGCYPTGVVVVTALEQGEPPTALVIGTFASASLAPPLVSFLPAKASQRWARIRRAGRFCVNVLAEDQAALSRTLAAPVESRLEDVGWSPSPASGAPRLEGVCAFIDCALEAVHDAGDHDFALCRVLDLGVVSDKPPLLFRGGGYGRFGPAD